MSKVDRLDPHAPNDAFFIAPGLPDFDHRMECRADRRSARASFLPDSSITGRTGKLAALSRRPFDLFDHGRRCSRNPSARADAGSSVVGKLSCWG
jgi:hypothetical protein